MIVIKTHNNRVLKVKDVEIKNYVGGKVTVVSNSANDIITLGVYDNFDQAEFVLEVIFNRISESEKTYEMQTPRQVSTVLRQIAAAKGEY